jgi:hypothetical protein
MTEFRPTVDIHGAGEALGPQGKPWSRNTVKRRMMADPSFPCPFDDGGRLQWFLDELLGWKESRPRRQYVAAGDADAKATEQANADARVAAKAHERDDVDADGNDADGEDEDEDDEEEAA